MTILTFAVIAVTIWSYRYFWKYRPFAGYIDQYSDTSANQFSLQINNATVRLHSNHHKILQITSQKIVFSKDHRFITAYNIHNGSIFNNKEKPVLHIDAANAFYTTPTGSIDTFNNGFLNLTGGVHAMTTGDKPITLQTQNLTWDANKSQINAPGDVIIVFPKKAGTATATDVVYDTTTHNMIIRKIHGYMHTGKLVK